MYLRVESEVVEVPLVKRNEVQQIVKKLMAGDGNLEGGPKNLTD